MVGALLSSASVSIRSDCRLTVYSGAPPGVDWLAPTAVGRRVFHSNQIFMAALSQALANRIADTVAGNGRLAFAMDEEAASHGAIALYGAAGLMVGLRPDGMFLQFDKNAGLPPGPLPPDWEATAIVLGAERYPWLSEAIPARPALSKDCSKCLGTGKLTLAPASTDPPKEAKTVICTFCRALGWVPS